MALYTDSDHLTLADLISVDPEIPEVAETEGISLMGDEGICRLAWNQCADEILQTFRLWGAWGYSGSYISWGAIGQLGGIVRAIRLSQIVVTERYARRRAPVLAWLLYRAIALFYEAAANRRVSDRYELKRDRAIENVKRYWHAVWAIGLPIVGKPLPCPGALHEENAGTWNEESVSVVAGGGEPARTYEIAITWVDSSRYRGWSAPGNGESAGSQPVIVEVPAEYVPRISIASLTPPEGATHWNVYAATPGQALRLQNDEPIPISEANYTITGALRVDTAVLLGGQQPETYVFAQRQLQRA